MLPPRDLAIERLLAVHRYLATGQEETALSLNEDLAAELEPPIDPLAVIGYVGLNHPALGERPEAREYLARRLDGFHEIPK